jgi:hypothetical protein
VSFFKHPVAFNSLFAGNGIGLSMRTRDSFLAALLTTDQELLPQVFPILFLYPGRSRLTTNRERDLGI